MKVYRITLNVRINEVQIDLVAGPGGQVGKVERVNSVQVTETAGEGDTPKAAAEQAMANGFAAYLEGLSEASDKVKLFAPGAGSEH